MRSIAHFFGFFILFLAGGALLPAPAAAAEPALKIAAGGCSYPPFAYKDSAGRLRGFEIDIADAIAHYLGREIKHECIRWDGLIPALMAGRIDAIIAAMDATPERAKRVDFSIPYYRAPAAFIGLKILQNAPAAEDGRLAGSFLQDKTVGILRASNFEKYLLKTYSPLALKHYDTTEQMLIDLKAGRLDLAFTDSAQAESDFLSKEGGDKFAFIGAKINDKTLLGAGSAAALRKGNTALLAEINAALQAIMADGTYDKISRKYWSFSVRP